ncbi:MAG: aldo/keto reductase [Pisciglobus halotolerans]|nr:aldo/keto reductase [Pisciglobus halotolerans]
MVESLMDRIPLNDGYTIPGLGIGTNGLTEKEAEEAVFYALTQGYRLVDTSPGYGNEEVVGRGINRAAGAGIKRSDMFVVTKVEKKNMGLTETTNSVNESIDRLNVGPIDLVLLSEPAKNEEDTLEAWRALENMVDSGRIHSIGVSNFTQSDLQKLLEEAKIRPAINQYEMYPGDSQPALNEFCDNENIVSMAYSPLDKGAVLENRHIQSISEEYGKTPSQIALRWLIARNIIAIPRSANKDHIRENKDIFNFKLADQDMNSLNELDIATGKRGRDAETYADEKRQRIYFRGQDNNMSNRGRR